MFTFILLILKLHCVVGLLLCFGANLFVILEKMMLELAGGRNYDGSSAHARATLSKSVFTSSCRETREWMECAFRGTDGSWCEHSVHIRVSLARVTRLSATKIWRTNMLVLLSRKIFSPTTARLAREDETFAYERLQPPTTASCSLRTARQSPDSRQTFDRRGKAALNSASLA